MLRPSYPGLGGAGQCVIIEDDPCGMTRLVVDDATVRDGLSGSLKVKRGPACSAASASAARRLRDVEFRASHRTQTGTAHASRDDRDFFSVPGAPILLPGQDNRTIAVRTGQNGLAEDDETSCLKLTDADGRGTHTAKVAILDDRDLPSLSLSKAEPVAERGGRRCSASRMWGTVPLLFLRSCFVAARASGLFRVMGARPRTRTFPARGAR